MRYKALKYFKTVADYQKYLQHGGECLDSVCIHGVDYTMHEYDMDGRNITYANKRLELMFDVDTENRYKFGFDDARISEPYTPFGLRNDIVYLD